MESVADGRCKCTRTSLYAVTRRINWANWGRRASGKSLLIRPSPPRVIDFSVLKEAKRFDSHLSSLSRVLFLIQRKRAIPRTNRGLWRIKGTSRAETSVHHRSKRNAFVPKHLSTCLPTWMIWVIKSRGLGVDWGENRGCSFENFGTKSNFEDFFLGGGNRFGEYTGKDIFGTRDLEKIFR